MSVVSIQLASPSTVVIRPRGYLGRETFEMFRECIEGSKYEPEHPKFGKCQIASLDQANAIVERLRAACFEVPMDEWTIKALALHKQSIEDRIAGSIETARLVGERMKSWGLALYPYQHDGVAFFAGRDRAILADSPGLGKSVQTLASIPKNSGTVVVCPAVVKSVWEDECKRWRPDLLIRVPAPARWWPDAGEVQIFTYDALAKNLDDLQGLPPAPPRTLLVGDEAHYVMTPRTKRAQGFQALSDAVRAARGLVWLLTATPLMTHPGNLYAVLMAADLAREAFGSHKNFLTLFNGVKNQWGGVVWGDMLPEKAEEIGERLKRVMLRRNKQDVLTDLPAKTYRTIRVEVTDRLKRRLDAVVESMGGEQWLAGSFLDELHAELLAEKKQHDEEAGSFTRFASEREHLAREKTPTALEIAKTFLEEQTPLVAFSDHLYPVTQLGALDGWAKIVGDVSPKARGDIVRNFQAGHLNGVAATIRAGGVGITLTRASDVLFVDRSWTSQENLQASDRLHRIGQKNAVMITTLAADHPLDQRIAEVNEIKDKMVAGSIAHAETKGSIT